MKSQIRFTFLFSLLFLFANVSYSQCAYVVNNSLTATATATPNINGNYTWDISFEITNSSRGGNSSLKYGLDALVPDPDEPEEYLRIPINPYNESCDEVGIKATIPPRVVTIKYSGSINAVFELDWQGYSDFCHCVGGTNCPSGFETTEGPLPVELISFSGIDKNSGVELNWITESEMNNRHFEIQRSENGRAFENIGMVEGQGSSSFVNKYVFIDKHALPFAYYRLKQVDLDGSFTFSEVINVKRGEFESRLQVYPSYATDAVTIRVETLDSRKSYLKVVNLSGQVMFNQIFFIANKQEYIDLDVIDYPAGIYVVSLSNSSENFISKFVVAINY